MSISLLKNIYALKAQSGLGRATDALSRSLERLSSGSRITKASDDSAGLAVALGLNRDARVYGRAIQNLNDGISALSIADSSLGQLSDVTTRLKELATQSANGSLSLTQRQSLDTESDNLVEEFNRLVATTRFNGVGLLDGSTENMRLQGGYGVNGSLTFGLVDKLSRTKGSGSFSSATTHTSTSRAQTDVLFADFDGDGVLDRVSVGSGGVSSGMRFFKGNGDGTFGADTQYDFGVQFQNVAAGDFDGDGDLDLFAGATATGSYLYTNNGSGTFSATQLSGVLTSNPIAVADFNGDGRADIAMRPTGGGVRIYNGTAGGSLSLSQTISSDYSVFTAADMDGDGDPDIATIDSSGNIRVLTNDGLGTLTAGAILGTGIAATDIEVADINDDGILDIIATGFGARGLSLGQSGGAYSSQSTLSSSLSFYSESQLADLNGDGYLDIISQSDFDTRLSIQFGDGTGRFGSEVLVNTTSLNTEVVDLNKDGILDLASLDASGNTVTNFGIAESDTSIAQFDLNTASGARSALSTIDEILNRINSQRGSIGAHLSRTESAVSVLHAIRDNNVAASSRITDVDVAMESAELAKNQILQQVSSAVLAQANQLPALVLSLLSNRPPAGRATF